MHKYDKIYVPIPKDQLSDTARSLSNFFMNKPLKAIPNVIVLTVEEARELFIAGVKSFPNDIPNEQNFQSYLQSKGITI